MSLFQSLDIQAIRDLIVSAQSRVAYIGPSMMLDTACALAEKFALFDRRSITVIVDYDESVFRLGYGELEAIQTLQESGIEPRKQPGLRISALIVDDQGWILHQSPMAVEDPNASFHNAMALSPAQVREVCIAAGVEEPGAENQAVTQDASSERRPLEIGTTRITQQESQTIKESIDSNPPQAFDLQRQVNVYTANLQFVDIELAGGRIESRTIRLPRDLQKQLFGNNEEVDSRLKASYKLLDSLRPEGLKEIRDEVENLRKYTRPLNKRLGRVMLKNQKAKFQEDKNRLEANIKKWKESAKADIKSEIEKSISGLASALAPVLIKNPPRELTSGLLEAPNEKDVTDYIKDKLYCAAPDSGKLVEDLELHCIFKDVTYEMLKDDDFKKRIDELYPGLRSKIMEEYQTAKTRTAPIEQDLFS